MPLLELENVMQAYGDHIVVQSLNFSLEAGAIACLLGASHTCFAGLPCCHADVDTPSAARACAVVMVARWGFMPLPRWRS